MPEEQKEREKVEVKPEAAEAPSQSPDGVVAGDGVPVADNGQPAAESRKERRAMAKEEKTREKEERKEEKAREKEERKQEKARAKGEGKTAKEGDAGPEPTPEPPLDFRRIGHKGADLIVEGNTIESFEAAVEAGAEIVELDVLRTRDGRLIVAHDYTDASTRRPLTLVEALDAFCEPPLDEVEIDCDLKLTGREAELAGAIAGHGLGDRAMVSTMEVESLVKLRAADPDLRLGWTYPKTRRDWASEPWARPVLGAGLYVLRRRLPKLIAERAPELGVESVWAYHLLISPEALIAAEEVGIELFAWTVDEPERVAELAALGVHGIVSNDPRILS